MLVRSYNIFHDYRMRPICSYRLALHFVSQDEELLGSLKRIESHWPKMFPFFCSKRTCWSRLRTSLLQNQTGVGSMLKVHHPQRLKVSVQSWKRDLSYFQGSLGRLMWHWLH
jgi:hypothetical protein